MNHDLPFFEPETCVVNAGLRDLLAERHPENRLLDYQPTFQLDEEKSEAQVLLCCPTWAGFQQPAHYAKQYRLAEGRRISRARSGDAERLVATAEQKKRLTPRGLARRCGSDDVRFYEQQYDLLFKAQQRDEDLDGVIPLGYRHARYEDLKELEALLFDGQERLAPGPTAFRRFVHEADLVYVAAESYQRNIGAFAVAVRDSAECKLHCSLLWVRPELRGRGEGKRLAHWVQRQSRGDQLCATVYSEREAKGCWFFIPDRRKVLRDPREGFAHPW